jgi:hypothetical protein
VSGGDDELGLEQPADEASSEDKLKIEEPDHRNGLLRCGAPVDNSKALAVKICMPSSPSED